MRIALARCSGLKRRVSSVGSAWDGVVKMEGEEIPEIAERGGSSIRSREWCLEVLSYSELVCHISLEKNRPEHDYGTYAGLSDRKSVV